MQVPSCRHGEDMHSIKIHTFTCQSFSSNNNTLCIIYTCLNTHSNIINIDFMLNLQDNKKIQDLFS